MNEPLVDSMTDDELERFNAEGSRLWREVHAAYDALRRELESMGRFAVLWVDDGWAEPNMRRQREVVADAERAFYAACAARNDHYAGGGAPSLATAVGYHPVSVA